MRPKNFRPYRVFRKCSACTPSVSWPAPGEWDRVVVDCASTADALRMLTLPATFGLYVERAWPRHRRLSVTADDARSAAVVELLERISSHVESLSALLADGDLVSAHLVLTPERVVAAEAARTLGSLALMGVRVEELIVNQVLLQDDSYEYRNLPEHPAFYWYTERIAEQQGVLDELDATIGEVALVMTPHLSGEPIGPKALSGLLDAARRRGGATPPGSAAAHRGPRIRDGTRVHLPNAASVAATRSVGR